MSHQQLFPKPRLRVLLATIGVLIVAIIVTAGMPVYLPISQSNAIGLPVIFFPVVWLALFMWVLFDQKLSRVGVGLLLLAAGHCAVIASGLGVV